MWRGTDYKQQHKENWEDNGTPFYLDYGGGYEILYIYQNPENCITQRVNVTICKFLT